MDEIKKFGVTAFVTATYISSIMLSFFFLSLFLEYFVGKPFGSENDWLYKYAPMIAIPLWLIHSLFEKKYFLYIFSQYLLASLSFGSFLLIIIGLTIIIEGNLGVAFDFFLIGGLATFIFNKVLKAIKSKIPNKRMKIDSVGESHNLTKLKSENYSFRKKFLEYVSESKFNLYVVTFLYSIICALSVVIFIIFASYLKGYFNSSSFEYFILMVILFPSFGLLGSGISFVLRLYKTYDDTVFSDGIYISIFAFSSIILGAWYINT